MKTMDLILAILGVMTVAFISVMVWTFWQYQAIPDTLVTCFFVYLVGECGIMGWIKTAKEKKKMEDQSDGNHTD